MGKADVDGLLDSLTSSQLTEWMAYYELEPFGYDGVLASLLANLFRDNEQTPDAYQPIDFRPRPPLTPEERQAADDEQKRTRSQDVAARMKAYLRGEGR